MTRGIQRQEPAENPDPHSPASADSKFQAEVGLWIQGAVEGDVAAFGELYRVYAENIYRYFFYRVRQDGEAQDLTAQVFLNAWKAIQRYQPKDIPFLVWLYAIARNLLINYNRRNRVRSNYEAPGSTEAELVADNSAGIDPLRAALRMSENEALVKAFERLNEEQQQVIYYRFVENWSHAEVAGAMRKSEGAVRQLQLRALDSLRRFMEKDTLEHDFDR